MMIGIDGTCPSCGTVQLCRDELELWCCTNDVFASFYRFTCPWCRAVVQRRISAQKVNELIAAGVGVSTFEASADVFEAHEGPPFTNDDLIDFHFWLEHVEGL